MIKYIDQMKNRELNTRIEYKKKKVTKFCDDILTFDIEVSSAWMDQKTNKLIPYTPGKDTDYWNSMDCYALPYIWQFSFNETVYYGREIEDFEKVLQDLPREYNYIIYVHNLSYEFHFLINFLEVADVFARAPHKPIYCRFKNYEHITFRCSFYLTNLSLASWGKQLKCLKAVGDLDYHKLRTPKTPLNETEMHYCEQDCIVVYNGILEHLKKYDNVFDIPLTSTGKVRRPVKQLVTSDYKYMSDIKKTIPKDCIEFELEKDTFAGGYTHGNRKYIGKVIDGKIKHVDIASSYPFSMCLKMPYSPWIYIGNAAPDERLFENNAYIFKLRFKNIRCISWNTYISASRSHGSGYLYDNGRVLSADELYITITDPDWITIKNNYDWDEMEVLGTWTSHKRYLPKIFLEFMLNLYKDKTELKNIDDPDGTLTDRYMTSKQHINSLFGMMVTSPFNSDCEFDINSDRQWIIKELTEQSVNEQINSMRNWYSKKWFLSYSVGCFITAYSRRRLWSAIEKLDKDVIYCDTDSIFYIGDHDFSWFNDAADAELIKMCRARDIDFSMTHPKDPKGIAHPLGQFTVEPECEKFKTLGAKKYVEQRDGQLYMTVAGVPKSAVGCLENNINNFKDGFVFDKDAPGMTKLEHRYLTDMKEVTWNDGYVSKYKYGIVLRPTSYELSMPKVYDKLLFLYDFMLHPNEADFIRIRGNIKK